MSSLCGISESVYFMSMTYMTKNGKMNLMNFDSEWRVSDSVHCSQLECRGIARKVERHTYFIAILMHEWTQTDLRSSHFSLHQPASEYPIIIIINYNYNIYIIYIFLYWSNSKILLKVLLL